MFSRFASGADGCLLVAIHAIGLPELAISWCLAVSHPAPVPFTRWFCFGLAVSQMLFRPRVWPGRTQVFGLQLPFRIRRRRMPSRRHSCGGLALVLAVSKMLFRPRVWPGRMQVFGLPELAVSHPAPTDAF